MTARQQTLIYGGSMAILLLFLKWVELRFIIYDHSFEIYAGLIAVLFTGLGIWLALRLVKPKVKSQTIIVEKVVTAQSNFVLNEKALAETGISKRELEVLQLMAAGLSNQEIAEKLFVSLNTIKTHSSKVFEKLEVNRRTQAISKAKGMGIIP